MVGTETAGSNWLLDTVNSLLALASQPPICRQDLLEIAVFAFTVLIIFVVALARRLQPEPSSPMSLDIATDFGAANVVVGLTTAVAVRLLDQARPYPDKIDGLHWDLVPVIIGFAIIYVSRRQAQKLRAAAGSENEANLMRRHLNDSLALGISALIVFVFASKYATSCLDSTPCLLAAPAAVVAPSAETQSPSTPTP